MLRFGFGTRSTDVVYVKSSAALVTEQLVKAITLFTSSDLHMLSFIFESAYKGDGEQMENNLHLLFCFNQNSSSLSLLCPPQECDNGQNDSQSMFCCHLSTLKSQRTCKGEDDSTQTHTHTDFLSRSFFVSFHTHSLQQVPEPCHLLHLTYGLTEVKNKY